jgi:putative acetyltransferase
MVLELFGVAAPDLVIAPDDPAAPDVRSLLEAHLAFAHAVTPAGHVHALDVEGLTGPLVTFFSARRDGVAVGVGALRHLDERHAELKSMHTAEAARRTGVGAAMVGHLLGVARERGYQRVSIETGTIDAFTPARTMYERFGFRPCPPFAAYTDNPHSVCMTLLLEGGAGS